MQANFMTGRRRIQLLLATAACALAATPATASAAPVSTAPSADGSKWTAERMRAAENLDPPLAGTWPVPGAPITRAAASDQGLPLTIPPLGSGNAAPGPADGPMGRAYESGEVLDPSAGGNRTHGRLFFTVPGKGDAACSGTAIRSNRRSLVLTAGHCVHGGGHQGDWARNVVFVPAYDQGSAPFGAFQATRLYSLPIWVEFGDPTGDVAVIETKANDTGKLQSVVGARGISFGNEPDQRYTAFGYPANPDDGFSGETERFCRSRFAGRDATSGAGIGPRTISINCDMTQGASGGGWLTDEVIVASLTSYGYPDLDDVVFGPYFGSLARELYEATQIRCKGRVATIVGTTESDRLQGTSRKDVIAGVAGSDRIQASGKGDIVCGGPGADKINGGAGADVLLGGGGKDTLIGAAGTDFCSGGGGKNKARGCERKRKIA
jgi:hypothetical protein